MTDPPLPTWLTSCIEIADPMSSYSTKQVELRAPRTNLIMRKPCREEGGGWVEGMSCVTPFFLVQNSIVRP